MSAASMFRLDTVPNCPRTRVLAGTLEELEVEYEVRTVPAGWFAARGQVGPALVHDDLEISELFTAMRFACHLTGRLLPASLADRTRVDCWLELYASSLRPAVQRLIRRPDELALDTFGRSVQTLQRAVAGRSWLLDDFSVADVPAIQLFMLDQQGIATLDRHPELAAYVARVAARPAWRHVDARLGSRPSDRASSIEHPAYGEPLPMFLGIETIASTIER